MGVDPRTIQRHLRALELEGLLLIDIEQEQNTGMVWGFPIRLVDKVFPPFKRRFWYETLGKLDNTKLVPKTPTR